MNQPPNGQARYGATPEDWQRLCALGFTRDLLPVVSDPTARIAPYSKMKALGKTPSRFSDRDMVAGIPRWTERQTTAQHVASWQMESAYGICVQTRRLRALDVDVDDARAAAEIGQHLRDTAAVLGIDPLPMRYRENSGKCLFAFVLDEPRVGDWTKRIVRVPHGMVEFLATRQQFIAHGTHTSGVRYLWRDLPEPMLGESFPVISGDMLEALWSSLVERFGIGDAVEIRAANAPRERRVPPTEHDPVALWLDASGWVLSQMRDGRLNITCPFEDQHTSDSNETATQYFPAGTGGFQQGHFRCLHAHCAARTDADYLGELGYIAEQFEVIAAASAVGDAGGAVVDNPQDAEEAWPVLARNAAGRIFSTIGNAVRAVASVDFIGVEIRHDTFREEIMLRDAGADELAWRTFTDADYVTLRMQMERRGFMPVGRDMVRDAVMRVASDAEFDSAQLWLSSLPPWDGVPRVDGFLTRICGAPDNSYVQAVSRYLWSALAGRVLSPGCQVDMVPILVGAQGIGKTSLVREIAPAPEFFMEAALDTRDVELSRRMRGKLVAEIGELRGLRTRELEAIKSFITRTHEQWVPKYREFATTFPRRFVFIGTTNEDEFLADPTGNRRWLPVRCGQVDRAALVAERLQLWAEGAALWRQHGVCWRDADALADDARVEHSSIDSWGGVVSRWADDGCGGTPPAEAGFTLHEAMVGALGFSTHNLRRTDEQRLAGVLKREGFERVRVKVGGERHWRWKRPVLF